MNNMKHPRHQLTWEEWEVSYIEDAVDNIEDGASIHSQVKRLWEGEVIYRSKESIRSKIFERRKVRK